MALLTIFSDSCSQLVPDTMHICKDDNFKKDTMRFLVGFYFLDTLSILWFKKTAFNKHRLLSSWQETDLRTAAQTLHANQHAGIQVCESNCHLMCRFGKSLARFGDGDCRPICVAGASATDSLAGPSLLGYNVTGFISSSVELVGRQSDHTKESPKALG